MFEYRDDILTLLKGKDTGKEKQEMAQFEQWAGFRGENWRKSVDVRNFIQENYTMYDGDESFLEEPTEATNLLWGKLQELQQEERAKGGVLDMDTEIVS